MRTATPLVCVALVLTCAALAPTVAANRYLASRLAAHNQRVQFHQHRQQQQRADGGRVGDKPPNILFIIDESTAGAAYHLTNTSAAPVPLPNLWKLAQQGTSFNLNYVQAPVCCPSRATIWSGRYPHHIPHLQVNPNTGLQVGGAWNNHEGLPGGYNETWADYATARGYNVKILGKTDYHAGGHTLTCRLSCWTAKAKFPYTLKNHSLGWYFDQPTGHVSAGNATRVHGSDWVNIDALSDWITNNASKGSRPWAGYIGTDIVHPAYVSNDFWMNKVDQSKIPMPVWTPLAEMHPEDFQQTMRKGMAGDESVPPDFVKLIRALYYAMIAEYDSMVGQLMQTLDATGQRDNTYVIATSDHGDLAMYHRQFYKMSPFDWSARVPLIISGPGVKANAFVNYPTSSFDLFPTLLDMMGATPPPSTDAKSLVPFLSNPDHVPPGYPNYTMSQFHGETVHLSWFLIVMLDGSGTPWKYITYGSGQEVPARLFNLGNDPDELNDLIDKEPAKAADLERQLRAVIDYPSIAEEVEAYNKDSFVIFRNSFKTVGAYREQMMSKNLRWHTSWMYDSDGCFAAIDEWLKTPNTTMAVAGGR